MRITMKLTVGPLPPVVYWRRRGLVAAVILVLLVTLTTCAFGGGSPKAQQAADTVHPKASPSAVAKPSPTVAPTPSPSLPPASPPSPSAPAVGAAATANPSAPGACTAAVVQVTAALDATKWTVGSSPRLKLTVINHGTTACQGDLGATQREFRVMGGGSWLWSSSDCQPDRGTQPALLQPGKAYAFTLTWSGLSSSRNCAGQRTRVGPGQYQLVTLWSTILSQPAPFTIAAKKS
ncbi:hypothetical protein [Fodinicola feengrottensis]|uniref:hypothetical protein n=1 Tax=Fodinicola feengrottensis TaxID=435914 RepID=UPI0013D4A727|nr:hypothetical protein [Fodinicola feengrottensis]